MNEEEIDKEADSFQILLENEPSSGMNLTISIVYKVLEVPSKFHIHRNKKKFCTSLTNYSRAHNYEFRKLTRNF